MTSNKKLKIIPNKIKVLIRTGGGKAPNKELGLGHVFRSINLAQKFDKHQVFFLIEDYGGVRKILEQKKFNNIILLPRHYDSYYDRKKTRDVIKNKEIDLLIVDRYKVKKKYLDQMKKLVKTVVISDLKNIEYPANLVVNGFIGFSNKVVKNKFGAKCLLGPKYQILNEHYKKANRKKKNITLLATFGGYDEKNIIEFLLHNIEKFIPKIKIKIILGPSTLKTQFIKKIEKRYSKKVKIINESKEMWTEISSAKFGLCSGGITSYEFAALKVPFGIICQVPHQLQTAIEWEKKKVAFNLGLINELEKKQFEYFLNGIMNNKFKIKKTDKIVDGKGLERAFKEICKII